MIKVLLFIHVFLFSFSGFADKLKYPKSFDPQKQNQTISFTENKGQVSDQNYKSRPDVLFGGMANGMAFHLRNNGISYQLNRVDSWKESPTPALPKGERVAQKTAQVPDQITIYRVDINWLNINKNILVQKGKALPGYDNYYTTGCPEGGALYVRSYTDVTLKNIYYGIDLHYYEKKGQLEYDYIVAPGADHKQIQFNIEGAESIKINNNGDLVIKTPLGEIIEQAPLVKQYEKILPAKWALKNKTVTFQIEGIDSKQTFIIDPSVLVRSWGSYYGGNGTESCMYSAVDLNGNAYICGQTASTNPGILATVGAFQTILQGASDNYLVKFSANGLRLWGTYYGGSDQEYQASVSADTNNNVFLFGTTASTNNISSPGSFQNTSGGGGSDSYLAKFDANGVRLWATYYGGAGTDGSWSNVTDQQGNIYLYGYVLDGLSGSTLYSPGSHQPNYGGGPSDLFIAKFDANGSRVWASYYGGNMGEYAGQCSVDASGNFYFGGTSASHNNIASPGSHQSAHGDNVNFIGYNGFLAKFSSGGIRQWSTYYGGSIGTFGSSCAAMQNGDVYFGGDTQDTLIIATPGCHQPNLFVSNAYITKFNSLGIRQWGSYYGVGNGNTSVKAMSADNLNNLYFSGSTGITNNPTLIATADGFQTNHSGGNGDGYFAKFKPDGTREWGSFYGGNGSDFVSYIGVDPSSPGCIYIFGETSSTNGTLIASNNGHQPVYSAGPSNYSDAFLARFSDPTTATVEFRIEKISIKIFPNPNSGEFTIKADEDLKVNIINQLGQIIQTINLDTKNNHSSSISNLSSGIYFINSDNGKVNEKIVVIR